MTNWCSSRSHRSSDDRPRAPRRQLIEDGVLNPVGFARLISRATLQRSPDAGVHRQHRVDVDDFRMGKYLERVLELVGDQCDEAVVTDTSVVRRHHYPKITAARRRHDIREQTSIQVAERTVAE